MQPGNLASSNTLTSRVWLDGATRAVQSWSLSRELSGGMPDRVQTALSGVRQATGTIVWAPLERVSGAHSPFDLTVVPRPGQRIVIEEGDGTNWWTVFTGRIDSSKGEPWGDVSSEIVDDIDQLDKPFRNDPLLRIMPPRVRGGAYRGVGASTAWLVDLAARNCGFNSTPNAAGVFSLHAPMQGSVWPRYGTVVDSTGQGTGFATPTFYVAPWGYAAAGFLTTYRPHTSRTVANTRVVLQVAPDHAGTAAVVLPYGSSTLKLEVNAGRGVYLQWNGTTVASIPSASFAGKVAAIARVLSNGTVKLGTESGDVATGPVISSTSALGDVTVTGAAGSRVAGLIIDSASTATPDVDPKFVHTKSRFAVMVDATPRIESQTSRDVLGEIAEATLSSFYLDEFGRLVWAPSDTLVDRAPITQISTRQHVFDAPFEIPSLSAASQVQVTWDEAVIQATRFERATLWEASSRKLEAGQTVTIVDVPEDEEWIAPDLQADARVGSIADYSDFTGRTGTQFGAVVERDENPDAYRWAYSGALDGTTYSYYNGWFERISAGAYKLVEDAIATPGGNLPVTEAQLVLTGYNVPESTHGQNLPQFRGGARVMWTENTATAAATGPSWAAALTHEAGRWIAGDGYQAQAMADWLGEQMETPRVTIAGLDVSPDPRLQLGDVITLDATGLWRVELRLLIVGIDRDDTGGLHTMRLTVRVLASTLTVGTYDEVQHRHETRTYDGVQALVQGKTYYDAQLQLSTEEV